MIMKIILTGSILLLMLGCSTMVRSTIGVHVDVDAEADLDVEITVGEQITGEAEGTFILLDAICIQCPNKYVAGVFGGSYFQLKAAATYNAMNGTGADLIINPQYVIEREWNPFWSKVHVTVTGHIGTINNIEKENDDN